MTTNTRGDHVRVRGYGGVAFWVLGDCTEIECGPDHDDGDWDGYGGHGDDCRLAHSDCVMVRMVGDDRDHHVDSSDLAALNGDEFCGGCGQIGCGHG